MLLAAVAFNKKIIGDRLMIRKKCILEFFEIRINNSKCYMGIILRKQLAPIMGDDGGISFIEKNGKVSKKTT